MTHARRRQHEDEANSRVSRRRSRPKPQPRTIQAPELTDLENSFDINDPLAPPVLLDLPLDAQIPQTYIEEESLRLQMYRRIAGMTHLESIDEMRREMIDRFGTDDSMGDSTDGNAGNVPEEVENLFYQIRVKILALRANVQNIGRELDQLVIRSEALENINRTALERRLLPSLWQRAEPQRPRRRHSTRRPPRRLPSH